MTKMPESLHLITFSNKHTIFLVKDNMIFKKYVRQIDEKISNFELKIYNSKNWFSKYIQTQGGFEFVICGSQAYYLNNWAMVIFNRYD